MAEYPGNTTPRHATLSIKFSERRVSDISAWTNIQQNGQITNGTLPANRSHRSAPNLMHRDVKVTPTTRVYKYKNIVTVGATSRYSPPELGASGIISKHARSRKYAAVKNMSETTQGRGSRDSRQTAP